MLQDELKLYWKTIKEKGYKHRSKEAREIWDSIGLSSNASTKKLEAHQERLKYLKYLVSQKLIVHGAGVYTWTELGKQSPEYIEHLNRIATKILRESEKDGKEN